MRLTVAAFAALLAVSSTGFAAEKLQPLMTVKGKQLLAEDFSGSSLPASWRKAKGEWTIESGALKGSELKADSHAGVVATELKTTSAIFQFDFQLTDGLRTSSFSFNDPTGHVCRVVINPAGFTINKDGSKKDKTDTARLLDSCAVALKPGKWYTMLVEIHGPEMLARVDEQHYALGSDAKIDREKTVVRYTVSGESLLIDNLKIWEASPNPAWTATKSRLEAAHPPKLEAPARGKNAKKKA